MDLLEEIAKFFAGESSKISIEDPSEKFFAGKRIAGELGFSWAYSSTMSRQELLCHLIEDQTGAHYTPKQLKDPSMGGNLVEYLTGEHDINLNPRDVSLVFGN